jgi:hypothetical protein
MTAIIKVRLVANRRTSNAVIGLGEYEVSRPVDLFDAVMRGFAELRKRCRIRSPYWLKVYVVTTRPKDAFLIAFLTTDSPDEIDEKCGQVAGYARNLAMR